MNSPANVIDLSTLYLRCYFYCMPAFMVYNFGAVVIAGNSAAVSLENMTVLFTPFIYVWFMFP